MYYKLSTTYMKYSVNESTDLSILFNLFKHKDLIYFSEYQYQSWI